MWSDSLPSCCTPGGRASWCTLSRRMVETRIYLDCLWNRKLSSFFRELKPQYLDSNKLANKMQLFFTSLLLDVHMWLNMCRASPRPSSGAYKCTRSFWSTARTRPTTFQPFPSNGRTRGS